MNIYVYVNVIVVTIFLLVIGLFDKTRDTAAIFSCFGMFVEHLSTQSDIPYFL